jgi:alkanesulfonate monooxygenase SsuD/methylene tetrahydromethanopterin reductase-like flavin-dependent oxidoreductase (luciferase family)
MRKARAVIDEGARAGGRDPSEVVPIFNSAVTIDDDGERARAIVKPYVARGLIYPASVQLPGWTEDDRQRLLSAYDYYNHLSPQLGAAKLVPDELVTSKAVAGTARDVAKQLQSIVDAGYHQIALLPMGNVETVVERLALEVMPLLQRRDDRSSAPEPNQ